MFRLLTGYKCPGCGMTHALLAVCQGHFEEAVQYNLLSVSFVPVLCMYLIYRACQYIKEKREDFSIWEVILLIILFLLSVC